MTMNLILTKLENGNSMHCNSKIICNKNIITIVLSSQEDKRWQKAIAVDIADMLLSNYNMLIKVEDFNEADLENRI